MTQLRRAIIIVLDGVGVGELPDADRYGDAGSNTLGNTAKAVGGLKLPNLGKVGLGRIIPVQGVVPADAPRGNFGKMAELSPGKDSTSGHWELAGLVLDRPFPTYPLGFPPEVIGPFQRAIGREILGNKAASGTEIIKELGDEHVRTKRPIVYTSADSVFQVAAHEEVIPVPELYQICRRAREILTGAHGVGRVIARPFIGSSGGYTRTERRKDFSLPPRGETVLDQIKGVGYPVVGVGKIEDLFAGQGLTEAIHGRNNMDNVDGLLAAAERVHEGLIMANLVDFDMLWGHRNDVRGFAAGLEAFDDRLPELLSRLTDADILIITADHGCDPTTASTDHSREYVPLLVYGRSLRSGVNLGIRRSFADVAATVVEALGVGGTKEGLSFLSQVVGDEYDDR